MCLVPARAYAKRVPGYVSHSDWVPTYSVQYESQTRISGSVGVVRGEVSDTLSVGGPTAQLAMGLDGAKLGFGYAWGLLYSG